MIQIVHLNVLINERNEDIRTFKRRKEQLKKTTKMQKKGKKMKRRILKKVIGITAAAAMMGTLFAGCGSSSSASEAPASSAPAASEAPASSAAPEASAAETTPASGEKYKIALSNSYMGNDWRQLMIKTTQVVAEKEPYASQVELDIVTCENTAEAQSASIDALVEEGYDAILIDAASPTALIPAIQRAQEAGIVIVSFDNTVTADGVYRVGTDLADMSEAWATWLVTVCGDGANIIMDTGIAGSTSGNTMYEAAKKVFDEHGVTVVSEFASEYADGVGQEQIANVLAANDKIDGVYSLCYANTVYNAFTDAGRDLVPTTSFNTNIGQVIAFDNNMQVLIGQNTPGLGAEAMKVAVDVLNGEDVPQENLVKAGFFTNDTSVDFGWTTTKLEEGVTFFRDLPDAFDFPAVPADFDPQVSAEEVSNYQQ